MVAASSPRRATSGEAAARGASCFPFGEQLNCLSVCGISEDATQRELHILFSACPGYVSSSILNDEASKRPYALVQFQDADLVLQASAARQGTYWEACSVSSEGSPRSRAREDAGVTASSPPSRSFPRSAAPPSSPSSPSRPKVEACRARLAAALSKKKMADLEEVLEEAVAAGLPDSDLQEPREVLQKNRHRLGVRQAMFASQKAKQRLAEARRSLEDDLSRPQSASIALEQAKEAFQLCGRVALSGDEQTLREESQSLSRAWLQRAEERLKAAAFASELQGLRLSVEEWETLGRVLGCEEEAPPLLSQEEVRQAVAQIVAEEAGARSAKQGQEMSLTYILVTVTLERDDWSFNERKWSILRHQARGVLQVEEHRALTCRNVEEALSQNAPLAELRRLGEVIPITASADLAARLRERQDSLEGRVLARWSLLGAMVASKVSTMMACALGPFWVKSAIKQARGVGFNKESLEAALDCFDRTEYQQKLQESLMEALSHRDLINLRSVIKEMEVVYVAEAPGHLSRFRLTMAQAKLRFLEEQAASASQLEGLLQVRRKSVLLEELPEAISNAKRLRVSSGSIARAEKMLEFASAQDFLQAAVEAGDRKAVRAALEQAQGCETFSDCSLEDRERSVQQALLFEKLSDAVQRNRLQVAREMLKEWHDQAFDPDAVSDIEAIFSKLDGVVAKAQATIDQLQQLPFASGTSALTAEGETMLKRLAAALHQFPQVGLRIDAYSGHSNDRMALELAASRGEAVKTALRKFSCKNKLLVKSWGNSDVNVKKPAVRITAQGQLCISDHMASPQK